MVMKDRVKDNLKRLNKLVSKIKKKLVKFRKVVKLKISRFRGYLRTKRIFYVKKFKKSNWYDFSKETLIYGVVINVPLTVFYGVSFNGYTLVSYGLVYNLLIEELPEFIRRISLGFKGRKVE